MSMSSKCTAFVRERPEGTRNPKLATGDIEVEAHRLDVLNTAKTPPFEITQTAEIDEVGQASPPLSRSSAIPLAGEHGAAPRGHSRDA